MAKILGLTAADLDPPLAGGTVVQSMTASIPHICLIASYTGGRFPQVYTGLKGHGAEGVVLKRRGSHYAKHIRPGVESRDWLKRRFAWD